MDIADHALEINVDMPRHSARRFKFGKFIIGPHFGEMFCLSSSSIPLLEERDSVVRFAETHLQLFVVYKDFSELGTFDRICQVEFFFFCISFYENGTRVSFPRRTENKQ